MNVICIVLMVWSALTLLFNVLAMFGGVLTLVVPGVGLSLLFTGFLGIFGSIFDIVVAALGVRGANDPAKIGPFYVLAVIGFALAAVSAVAGIFAGDFQAHEIVNALLTGACAVLASNIRKESR
ncbi:MAG: hypothetical protein IJC51_01540 [Eggerthellaceae bacterium]|nr:hypothetical protein [Eggerthellaceae bacterium]